ncbi:MAG TPA: winged helix-turn-helix domain-containing protein [Anaerolineales bacterium]|nr:winged helix-turn-helix domain-containing protein [Anaerolineales bacterium]
MVTHRSSTYMSIWDAYPPDYRAQEVQAILTAVKAGECASVVGLSGAGKSNLLGYLAHTQAPVRLAFALVDCNRLPDTSPEAFFRLARSAVDPHPPTPREAPLEQSERGSPEAGEGEFAALDAAIEKQLAEKQGLCLLFDRFDALAHPAIFGNLRALRDAHKYRLTFLIAARRPLDPHNELAELFYAHTLWLGPLSESDARWNVARYAERRGVKWDEAVTQTIVALSRGYASLLRAVCEAYADGAALEVKTLLEHRAVRARVEEFWAGHPGEDDLRRSGLEGHPLLTAQRAPTFDTSQLTAKELLLFDYLAAHAGKVCEKDDLIRAAWPEDKVFERGVRDDSLAQLVRRLREKIEPDPANPRNVLTVAGRGYKMTWKPS